MQYDDDDDHLKYDGVKTKNVDYHVQNYRNNRNLPKFSESNVEEIFDICLKHPYDVEADDTPGAGCKKVLITF